MIRVICMLTENKSLSLKPTKKKKKKKLTFQLNFVLEIFIMDSVIPSLEKYL